MARLGRYMLAGQPVHVACSRYIELNPVRAGMVAHPRDHAWSSYRANAHGAPDPIVTQHPLYAALGRSRVERKDAYRALFANELGAGFIDALRRATNGGWALGERPFQEQVAATGRRRPIQPPLTAVIPL